MGRIYSFFRFLYSGGRTAKDIVAWLKKKTGPPAIDLQTVEAAKSFVEGKEVAVLGFFKNAESDEAKTFVATALDVDDIEFGMTANADVFAEYKVEKDNAIVLLKTFDEGRNDFDGEYTVEAITAFIRGNQLPLVTEFTDEVGGGEFVCFQ